MKQIILSIFLSILFIGCVGVSPDGLTLRIPASTVMSSVVSQFPVTRNTDYGKLSISNPDLLFAKSDKITLGGDLAFNNSLLKNITAKLKVSGNVIFNQEKRAFFIQNAIIDNLDFNKNSLTSMFGDMNILKPIIQQVISQIPIYTLEPKKYKYITNAFVDNGNINLTLGF